MNARMEEKNRKGNKRIDDHSILSQESNPALFLILSPR